MNISLDTSSIYQQPGSLARNARNMERDVTPGGMTFEPEKLETEELPKSSPFSFQKELTPEEEKRLIYLQNLLSQLLTMVDGKPTEDQKQRIKEVEEEMSEITGVKMRSSISDTTDKMIGDEEDETEEEQKKQGQRIGIDPKDVAHAKEPSMGQSNNPGMQMLRQNSLFGNLQSLLTQPGALNSLTA